MTGRATTSEGAPSLVTPEMEARRGLWGLPRASLPIERYDIRVWAITAYWPETAAPLYWDEEYAAGTRWGGIVAPQDFNPFGWPVGARRDPPAGFSQPGVPAINGGQSDEYGVPMRPGDWITERSRLLEWRERETRMGSTVFVTTEVLWLNQRGEFVRRRLSTNIRYRSDAPPSAESPAEAGAAS
ncbi:MAG: MaoC family dehydratase N-terminal domain-containing protein [Chloroflexi bacterium]|nr:MaoC family dehydratase N-terminal domain-containing protein [Chloroflexota bacterium]